MKTKLMLMLALIIGASCFASFEIPIQHNVYKISGIASKPNHINEDNVMFKRHGYVYNKGRTHRIIPILLQHNPDMSKHIGNVTKLYELSNGTLMFEAIIYGRYIADDIEKKIVTGVFRGISIGIITLVQIDHTTYTEIVASKIMEISLVTIPADKHARILTMERIK